MKTFLIALLTLTVTHVWAQQAGTVTYERKINMHRRINDEELKARIPEFRITKFMLVFKDSISVYKNIPDEIDPFDNGGRGGMTFRVGGFDGGTLFKNFSSYKLLEEQELGDKTYVIEDSIRQQPWKLTEDRKTILGHSCRKAILKTQRTMGVRRMSFSSGNTTPTDTANQKPQIREIEIAAWFAEDMMLPVGPATYGSLPGLILEVDENNGETIYVATEINAKAENKELKEPKGKRISRKEFNEKREELFRNMQMNGGGTIRFGA